MSKYGLTEERYNQMLESFDNDDEWVEGVVFDWGVDKCNKGYDIFDYDGTGLLELCKIDDVCAFDTDYSASIKAEQDGIKIIPENELPNDMPFGMKYHRWIDTEENRKNIFEYCEKMNKEIPEYIV